MNISKKLRLLLCISFFSIFSITSFAQTVGQSGNGTTRVIKGTYSVPSSYTMYGGIPQFIYFIDGKFTLTFQAHEGKGSVSDLPIRLNSNKGGFIACEINVTSTKGTNTWSNTITVTNKPGWSCIIKPPKGTDPNFTPNINVVKL